MPEIVFKHHRETTNLGDAVCSPYDHLPDLATRGIAIDLAVSTPPADTVIFGGGKIMGGLYKVMGPNDFAARHRVAWGVSTVQKFPVSWKYWRTFRSMTLVGSRDWGDKRFPFAPCVTCLSPYFEMAADETEEVVLYIHHWKSAAQRVARPEGIPVMENNNPSLESTIRFLAGARTVVSNSYHGVYWGLLLGKKVLCLPFSNKFQNYRISPGYAAADTWPDAVAKAQGSDEMLGICREATVSFRKRVGSLIGV